MLGRLNALLLVALILGAAGHAAAEPRRPAAFSLGAAGVASPQAGTLLVAAPLANLTTHAVADVRIDHIRLAAAPARSALPMRIGAIGARASVVVQADFDSHPWSAGGVTTW